MNHLLRVFFFCCVLALASAHLHRLNSRSGNARGLLTPTRWLLMCAAGAHAVNSTNPRFHFVADVMKST